jgi:membrane protein
MKLSFKTTWAITKESFSEFMAVNVLSKSAALAYYTVFALAPMLVVIITIVQFFYGAEAITGNLYPQIASLVGPQAGSQIQEMIKNAAISNSSTISTIFSVIILILTATGVFSEIQDSINNIWHLKAKPKKNGLMRMVMNRLLSFSMVVGLGFILLVSLVVNAAVEALMDRLQSMFPNVTVYISYAVNLVVTFAVTTLLFAVIFKVLPDAKIRWKNVFIGAVVTAILFMLGKFGITLYLGASDIGSTYGAAGSIIIILVWVYYSSMILYFGAILTRVYAQCSGHKIYPNDYAVYTRELEVESKGSLQSQPNTKKVKADVKEAGEEDQTKRVGF